MPGLCTSCHAPASDEYHFYEYVPAMGQEMEVVWDLCDRCCEFAIQVVEDIANLEDGMKYVPSCHKCGAVAGAKYADKDVCPECFVELKNMERKS